MIDFKQKFVFAKFQADEEYIDYVRGKLMKIAKNNAELGNIDRYIKDLSAGRYYNTIKVIRSLGFQQSHASVFWRSILAAGAIRRVEFAQMKPCLVHETELPVMVKLLERFKIVRRGWKTTVMLVKEALHHDSNGTKTEEGANAYTQTELLDQTEVLEQYA